MHTRVTSRHWGTRVNSRDLDPSLPGADDPGCWRKLTVTRLDASEVHIFCDMQ